MLGLNSAVTYLGTLLGTGAAGVLYPRAGFAALTLTAAALVAGAAVLAQVERRLQTDCARCRDRPMSPALSREEAMAKEHRYRLTVEWTGNAGTGTSSYRAYERAHEIRAEGKPAIPGSSDPGVPRRGPLQPRGPARGLAVGVPHALVPEPVRGGRGRRHRYVDHAEGIMVEPAAGVAKFERVIMRPKVSLAPAPTWPKPASCTMPPTSGASSRTR